MTGHLAAYTFVSPVLQQISGINVSLVGVLLFGYGIAGLVGNFVAGAAIARNLRLAVFVIIDALTVVMALFPLLGGSNVSGVVFLVLWGLSFGGVSVTMQTWIVKAAPRAIEAASALQVSVFNLSIALGALVGGVVVDAIALSSVLWLGGVLVLLATGVVWRAPAD